MEITQKDCTVSSITKVPAVVHYVLEVMVLLTEP